MTQAQPAPWAKDTAGLIHQQGDHHLKREVGEDKETWPGKSAGKCAAAVFKENYSSKEKRQKEWAEGRVILFSTRFLMLK